MFNLGTGEMILLFVVALLLFGPKRMPEFGKALGETMGAFRKAMNTLSEPILSEVQTQVRQVATTSGPVAGNGSAARSAANPPADTPEGSLPVGGEGSLSMSPAARAAESEAGSQDDASDSPPESAPTDSESSPA